MENSVIFVRLASTSLRVALLCILSLAMAAAISNMLLGRRNGIKPMIIVFATKILIHNVLAIESRNIL